MAIGTIFTELDLDTSKFKKKQEQLLTDIKTLGTDAEHTLQLSFQNLGVTTDKVYQGMAAKAQASYDRITRSAQVSADEQFRAQSAAISKINALNQEMTKNPLYEQLGIRSTAAIKAQMDAINLNYDTIKKSGQASAQDLINIERAKNDQIKALNKEMTGDHEMSMASMTRSVLRLYAAYYVLSTAAQMLVQPFTKGFKAVEEYNQSVASMAAMVVTFSEAKPGQTLADQWKSALTYSTAIVPVLEQIAARTLLSGQETTALANAFARSGVFIRANNAAQIEGFTRISNALPLMTKGQEIMRQINTEIRSVMTGQNEQSSMMLQTLKALPGFSKENLELWRQQGTVLENVGRLLEGFGPATALLENQWQAVKSTLDTTVTQILRGGMLGAYGELILSAKDLDEYLRKNKDTLIDEMSKWVGNFLLTMYTIKAEVLRLAMLLDKLGGSISSAQMLLYGPGKALGIESSSKRFDAAANRNIEYESRYKESDKELEKLAIRYNNLEQSISKAGLAKAKLDRDGMGGNEEFKAKPGSKKDAEKENKIRANNLAEATAQNRQYYDDLIAQSNHWLKMQQISGQGDLEATKQVIEDKKVALNKWYDKQAASLIKYQSTETDGASKLAADLEKLWKDYSRSWNKIKYEDAEIAARITKKAEDDAIKAMEREIARGVKETEENIKARQRYEDFVNDQSASLQDKLDHKRADAINKEKEKYEYLKTLEGKGVISHLEAEEEKRKATEIRIKAEREITSEKFMLENKEQQDIASATANMFSKAASLYAEDSRERQALSTASKAATIAEIALQSQKNLMIAVGAVVQQGTGDPYTAFARIAAMIAVVTSVLSIVGIAFGGGGSSSASASTAALPTSTVLGAKAGTASESISKSWELMQDTYDMEYRELSGIYNEMKSLNDNITGLVTSIIRTGGVGGMNLGLGTDTTFTHQLLEGLFGGAMGKNIGSALSSIFGGEKTSTLLSSGLTIGGATIGQLLAGGGMGAGAYSTVGVHESGGWFGSDKNYQYNVYGQVNASVSTILDSVFRNMGQSLVSLAKGLGSDVTTAMNYTFSGAMINLQGLDSEGISKSLNSYFSAAADTAVETLFGTLLRGYQEVGEGLMETATRILTDKGVVSYWIEKMNQSFNGTIPAAIQFSETLITIAGSLKDLTDAMQTYYDKFFTDSEKQAKLRSELASGLGAYGYGIPETRAGYRSLVESLNLTTDAGQKAYVALMQMSEGADTYYKYLEDAKSKISATGYSTNIEYQRALAGLPKYADGGSFGGGWRIVGENGPEIEYTGPSRIYSSNDSKSMLSTGELVAEIRALREELEQSNFSIATYTQKTAKLLNKWDGDGMPDVRA